MGAYLPLWISFSMMFLITVTTGQAVEFTIRPKSVSVREGDNVTFVCRMNVADPNIIWTKETTTLPRPILFAKMERYDAPSRMSIINTYDLVITNVMKEDNGVYACRTTNAGIQTATLTVLIPPGPASITRDDVGPVYTEGKIVKFNCSSTGGNPNPSIIWLKNGNISSVSPEYKASSEIGGTSSSIISVRLDKTDHQANYSCLVYNEVNINNKLMDYVVLNVKYSPSIAFQPYSPIYFVKMGSNIEIFCDVDANPPVSTVTWSKDGIGLSGTNPRRVLSPVTKSDNGTYTCTARNSIGEHSGSFDVNVQYAPILSASPTMTVNEGDSVNLNCNVDANPKPFEVVWSKMAPNGAVQNKVAAQTLKISAVNRSDAGNYSCRAQSQLRLSGENVEFVTSEVFSYIYVQYKPGKASLGVVPDVDVGDRLEITCTATPNGYPEPIYNWIKDGQTLSQNRQTLVIASVKLTDNGRYSCTPTNNRGSGETAFVDVNVYEPPAIVRKPEVELSVFLIEPNLLTLTCEVRGYPQPRVSWYQDGETQPLNTRPDLFTVVTTSKPVDGFSFRVESMLQFKGSNRQTSSSSGQRIGLQIRDMGNYSCQADSDKHTDTPTTITKILINFPPILEPSPKVLAASKQERAELLCTAQGYPDPSIQWYYQGQALSPQMSGIAIRQEILSGIGRVESRLSVLNVTEKAYGLYKCVIRNGLGNVSQDIILTRKSPPEQPTNVTSPSNTWESVMLTWIPGFDGGYNQKFYVQITTPGASTFDKMEVLPASSRSYNVTRLRPAISYTFQIVSENELGLGPPSQPIVVTTNSLFIPSLSKIPSFDTRSRKLLVTSPYDNNYCLKVEVKTSKMDWTQIHGCMMVMGGNMEIPNHDVTAINVTVCLSQRTDVCGLPLTAEMSSTNEAQLTEEHVIIIACVCGVIIVTLLIILFCFIFRRRRNAAKTYQGGNQGDPPPYNAVPPNKKPQQGYDNQGMDNSDLQLTTATSAAQSPTTASSPTPSVHAISTSYTNSSYGPLELNYSNLRGNNYNHPNLILTGNSNRMDGFQNRDNTVGVPRTATKDKYIDLHDRGSDPMMGSDGYNANEPSPVGAGGKPKKHQKIKWRWQWKKKEYPVSPSPQFAHTPPGHTCSLPCCNHEQDDLLAAKAASSSSSQRGCVPVPIAAPVVFSNNNFFMKRISGIDTGLSGSSSRGQTFEDGWESRSVSGSYSQKGRGHLKIKNIAKVLSKTHVTTKVESNETHLRRRKQLAPWEQIRCRQMAFPGSATPHRITFLNFQPGESSDFSDLAPPTPGHFNASTLPSAEAIIKTAYCNADEHDEKAICRSPVVLQTLQPSPKPEKTAPISPSSEAVSKRLLNSQLPPVPSGVVESEPQDDTDSLDDISSVLDEHLYDIPSDILHYNNEHVSDLTGMLTKTISLPHIPSQVQKTSDALWTISSFSDFNLSDIDSVTYHGSISDSQTSSYMYNGSLVSNESNYSDSSGQTSAFLKSNYLPAFRKRQRVIKPILRGKASPDQTKQPHFNLNDTGSLLCETGQTLDDGGPVCIDKFVPGLSMEWKRMIKLWDVKGTTLNRSENIYSTFPLRRPLMEERALCELDLNKQSRHRHHSDVSSDRLASDELYRLLKTSDLIGCYNLETTLDMLTKNDKSSPSLAMNVDTLLKHCKQHTEKAKENDDFHKKPFSNSDKTRPLSSIFRLHEQKLSPSNTGDYSYQLNPALKAGQSAPSSSYSISQEPFFCASPLDSRSPRRIFWADNNIVNWRLQAEQFKDKNLITLIL